MNVEKPDLDLTFFATGTTQHVLVDTLNKDNGLVYKIPASYGYLLPFSHPYHKFRKDNLLEKFLHVILINVPDTFYKLVHPRSSAKPEHLGKLLRPIVESVRYPANKVQTQSREVAAAYSRRAFLKRFNLMITILQHLSQVGIADVILPTEIIAETKAIVRLDDHTMNYKGPILCQSRADRFLKVDDFTSFDWAKLIEAQHRMWRHGVALEALGEILGPKNWAILNGRLFLGDTSHITKNYRRALDILSDNRLDIRVQKVLGRPLPQDKLKLGREYFDFIRRGINQSKFTELWRCDLDTR